MTIIIASGYFDPIHVGHIEYLKLAKQLGDKLIVVLNNEQQCVLKKGTSFMPQEERKIIIEALEFVDEVFESIDKDKSICESIKAITEKYKGEKVIFANGGDRFVYEIPETPIWCGDSRRIRKENSIFLWFNRNKRKRLNYLFL